VIRQVPLRQLARRAAAEELSGELVSLPDFGQLILQFRCRFGGFGVGLTGALKVNTKEDMAENSRMIVLWGANIASQPKYCLIDYSSARLSGGSMTLHVWPG
jgi:hypothetical protein